MKSIFIWLAGCICLTGCGSSDNSPPPAFVGGPNFAVVATNTVMDGGPRADAKTLYYFPNGPKSSSALIWPMLTEKDLAVFDQLVVFSGGTSGDLTWEFYPSVFAYTGGGTVVDISLPACRHIPGWKPDWTNYAFAVVSASNNEVRLDASQRTPVDPEKPKRMEVVVDKADIMKAVTLAQTNQNIHVFESVTYHVAD